MAEIVFSEHALQRMELRKLGLATVLDVIRNPTQVIFQENGRVVHQAMVDLDDRRHVLRAVLERQGESLLVITVLDSSKIRKYWEAK